MPELRNDLSSGLLHGGHECADWRAPGGPSWAFRASAWRQTTYPTAVPDPGTFTGRKKCERVTAQLTGAGSGTWPNPS
ncbi:hypothetical protein ACFYO2_43890 [Streptomyces sp. NPDC006602]|uniref:hypothetical protein n=1 Tax=Streptomyces sp. NPDC006602 TaxID=3364751 RepID=UPI0036CB8683